MEQPVVQERIQTKKEQFLELFAQSSGTVSAICVKVGVSRETFYRWRKEDTAFADGLAHAQMSLRDEIEDKLLERIFVHNDGAAIRYYLDRRHPDYNPKNRSWGNFI